ncbi:hypothetical protein EC957_005461 [Mortierella hygrophila]|uniref:Monopolin complex subunit Csm1/Pcs1 C-terminal domain-containing protein n=1 Tax=Mortierella hygrophila TaxID=979708 RepID=A0A9P6EZ95_9FUNG|nr:hypothetical protein EC957_005461 [Mortierella hygrophila]
MVPKPKTVKRTKAYVDSEAESEVEIRSGNTAKKRAVTYIDAGDNDNDNDAAAYKPKQPQPRPKKKGSVNTAATKQVSAPATTTAYGGSSNKQKSALGDIYNLVHNRSINNKDDNNKGNGSKSSSMLKARKDTSSENQENIDVRKPKDDGGKTAKRSLRQSTADMSREQLETALDDLRDKYRRLQQLRETDAERNLAECRGQLDETIRSAENYRAKIEPQLESALRTNEKLRDNNEISNARVRILQRQVRDREDEIKQRDQEDKIKAKTASMESVLASPDVTPSTASVITAIKMYENLSGFKLVPRDIFPRSSKDKVPAVWDCEHSGPRGTLRFTLTYNYTTSVVTYVPKIDPKRDEKLLKNLPDYLTDEIEFDRKSESKFFWRILNFNNDDDA